MDHPDQTTQYKDQLNNKTVGIGNIINLAWFSGKHTLLPLQKKLKFLIEQTKKYQHLTVHTLTVLMPLPFSLVLIIPK